MKKRYTVFLVLSALVMGGMIHGFMNCPAIAQDASPLVLHDPLEGIQEQAPPKRTLVGSAAAINAMFEPGRSGNAAHFKTAEKTAMKYPASTILSDEGSIEFWIAFDESPSAFEKQHTLMMFHSKSPQKPDWWKNMFILLVGGEKEWGRVMIFMICDGQSQRNSISTSIIDWQPGQWHHVAVTWKINAQGDSAMALYLDQKLVSHKNSLTIMQDKTAINADVSDANYGHFWFAPPIGQLTDFKLDDFRAYNVRRQYSQSE